MSENDKVAKLRALSVNLMVEDVKLLRSELDDATRRAVKLGAGVIKQRTRGPAGDYSVVRDPGGAPIALWQKA